MLERLVLIASMLFIVPSFAADYIDTQYGPDGLEVHIKKVSTNHNVLTVVFEIENTGDEEVEYLALPVSQVFYNTNDKKYPVLKDAEDKWLASTIAYSNSDVSIFSHKEDLSEYYTFTLDAGKTKIGWAKFEAPQDSDWPLDLSFPGISPFSISKPE